MCDDEALTPEEEAAMAAREAERLRVGAEECAQAGGHLDVRWFRTVREALPVQACSHCGKRLNGRG